jgi:hypothetical protein
MPITLTALRNDRRETAVEYEGESAQIVYRPSAYTPETEDGLRGAVESGRPARGLATVLSQVLLEWEVVDDDGNLLPVTLELMMQMPNAFLVAISNAVSKDMGVASEDRKNSGGGSLKRAS